MRHCINKLAASTCLLFSVDFLSCSRHEERIAVAPSVVRVDGGHSEDLPDAAVSPSRVQAPALAAQSEERTIHFAWKPDNARASEYAMIEPEDQHPIVLMRGVEKGNTYPVVVALHGQPRRGQAPRSYAFPNVVAEVTRELVQSGEVGPLVLATPVFRFEGRNWPDFDVADFLVEVRRVLLDAGLTTKGIYVFGHSGAAGCGGGGLNRVADASPSAVGFFDTCVGAGFVHEVGALTKNRVPTLIIHSVETAGFHPRQPTEYDVNFDFGKVYSTIALHPSTCPTRLPEAPLRLLAFRCATNDGATTQALVLDTGRDEKAHEALVPVAVRYFLREYLGRQPLSNRGM